MLLARDRSPCACPLGRRTQLVLGECGRIASVNPATALATVVVDEMVRHGVREAVLCPGSRSAVFAYALLEADRAGRLRLHVRVDERSAGFLALGLAKLTAHRFRCSPRRELRLPTFTRLFSRPVTPASR
jgi:hypothetical protein